MEKVFAKELIKRFNKLNDKRHNPESEQLIEQVDKAVMMFGEDFITQVIENVRENSIYKIIDIFFLKDYKKKTETPVEETPVIKVVEQARPTGDMTLGLIEQALAQVIADKYVPKITEAIKENVNKYVEETYGKVTRKIEYVVPNKGKVEEVVHEEFDTVVNFMMVDEPVMLVGPAGSGKNVLVKQVSKLLNLDFYFTNAVTQEYKITGFIDAMGKYHETEFYKAFKNGGIFFLDEMDASIPEVLILLNAAIANRYFDFPNGKIEAHPDFRVISAGNTFGHGASYQYVGRNQLDGASLNRFAILEIGYSPNIEDSLSSDKELVTFIRSFRDACEKTGNFHIVSYRELARIEKMKQTGMKLEKILRTCLVKNLDKNAVEIISREMTYSGKYKEALKKC